MEVDAAAARKLLEQQDVGHAGGVSDAEVLGGILGCTPVEAADLAAVIVRWRALPQAVRSAIAAMVRGMGPLLERDQEMQGYDVDEVDERGRSSSPGEEPPAEGGES